MSRPSYTNDRSTERIRYRRVSLRIWNDEKVCRLSRPQPNGQSLWFYFIFGPQTTIVPGLVRGGEASLAEALDWPLDEFKRVWRELESNEMAKADWKNRLVWLPNGIVHNAPESPNVCIQWHRAFRDEFPACDLLSDAKRRIVRFLSATRVVNGKHERFFAEAFTEAFTEGQYTPLRKGLASSFPESGTGTGTGTGTGVHTRGPLITPPKAMRHLTHISGIGQHVPGFLHDELRLKLMNARSLDEGAADRALLAWYLETETAWTGKASGDEPTKFWRVRFGEWVGTSATAATATSRVVAGIEETRRKYLGDRRPA